MLPLLRGVMGVIPVNGHERTHLHSGCQLLKGFKVNFPKLWESRGSYVQGYLLLHKKFQASLAMSDCVSKEIENKARPHRPISHSHPTYVSPDLFHKNKANCTNMRKYE